MEERVSCGAEERLPQLHRAEGFPCLGHRHRRSPGSSLTMAEMGNAGSRFRCRVSDGRTASHILEVFTLEPRRGGDKIDASSLGIDSQGFQRLEKSEVHQLTISKATTTANLTSD